jgi:O-antigen/teichoic acid export membrane protein
MFSASASEQRATEGAGGILETGTRWLFVFALPLCILLWLLAPKILAAWVGVAHPDAIAVFRLITASALLEAIRSPALIVLWVRGALGLLLGIFGSLAVANLLAAVCLLQVLGVPGAAWAIFLPSLLATIAILYAAAGKCRVTVSFLARRLCGGLFRPTLALVAAALLVSALGEPGNWTGIILAATVGIASYVVVFYRYGSRQDERAIIREILQKVFSHRRERAPSLQTK